MADRDLKPGCDQIIDILPDPFVIIDRHFRIVAANRKYTDHFGVTPEAVVGQYCHKVSHHSEVPCSQVSTANTVRWKPSSIAASPCR